MATDVIDRQPKSKKFIDRVGARYGTLTVISFAGFGGKFSRWRVRCDCGNVEVVFGNQFATSHPRRKVCCKKCNGRHGLTNDELYCTWSAMIARCRNPEHPAYPSYGGRGILVCDRWANDVSAFIADMGPRPTAEHSIGRIDNDGGYSPDNCEWQTQTEQARNTRSNRKITSPSGETLLACEWCERLKISHQALYQRLDKMPEHVAVSYAKGCTSPEHQAWIAEMKMNTRQIRWREKHLQKLAREWERILSGDANTSDVAYLSHAERRVRRAAMAKAVKDGQLVIDVANHFGVTIDTVRAACKEHKVKL